MKVFLVAFSALSLASGFAPLAPPSRYCTFVIGTHQMSSKDNAPESSDEMEKPESNADTEEVPVASSGRLSEPPSEPNLQPVPQAQKELDPLVRSLTRMDPETANAPTMKVPLWGELILDQSLFVLLPVAAFALIGFFFSIYIALNASDAFVQLEEAATVGKKDEVTVDSGCRGICGPQEQDIEGLRVFMSNFAK